MEHMKRFIMIGIVIAVAAAAAFMIKQYFASNEEVKIQSFCLGLCGENKDGRGGGIGFGASKRGPLVIAGPWGDNEEDEYKKNHYSEDDYNSEDDYHSEDDYDLEDEDQVKKH